MKKLSITGIFVLLFLLLLSACSSSDTTTNEKPNDEQKPTTTNEKPAEAPAKEGGSVTIAFNSEPGNLNPMVWATTSDTNVTHMVFDSLVIPDE